MTNVWLHPLLQRAYYIPLLLMALWFGWRGGLLGSLVAAILYIPHIKMAWHANPEYSAAQQIEIVMFFILTALIGILADHERAHRRKAEETAHALAEANARLQSSFEQLRRADRLAAMGELSAGLAHEIRNPLGALEGAMQIIQRPNVPEVTKTEFGEMAQRELDRLKRIVNQFLDFARPPDPRPLATDPNVLLESVAKLVAESAKMKGVQIRLAGAADMPEIMVDAEQIRQVVLNLVLNAIQAMPSGGEILLRAARDGDSVSLDVVDQGVGISQEDLERIFDPFFTTRQEGTGLGLSIAARIISQHGGQIEPRRNPDQGMTFSVILPAGSAQTPTQAISEEGK
jgi:signal transduction histidine kinase